MTIYSELLAAANKATIAHSGQTEGESDQAYIARLARAVATITGEEFNETLSEAAQVWFDEAADALNAEKPLVIPDGFREPPPPPVKIGRPKPMLAVAPAPEPEPEPILPPPAEPAPMPPPAQHPPTPPLEAEAEVTPVEAFVSDAVDPLVKPKRKRTRKAKVAAPPEPPPEDEEDETRDSPEPEPEPITEPEPEAAVATEGNGVSGGPTPSQRVRQYLLEDQQLTIDDIVAKLTAEHLEALIKRSTISTLRYDTVCTLLLARQAGWGPQP